MRDVLAEIADRLAHAMESWRSIEVKERRDRVEHESGAKSAVTDHYTETALGQRRYDFFVPGAEGKASHSYNDYADGRRFGREVIEDGRQKMVEFRRAFGLEDQGGRSTRGATLSYLYLDHKPLHEVIREGQSLGQSRRLGRECEVVLLTGKKFAFKPVDLIYELDRETGFPLAIRSYATETGRQADRPEWTWEATSLERVGQLLSWPMKSVQVSFKPSQEGKPQPLFTQTITVESLKFDQDYPESLFWPTLQPGATVWDKIEGKHWVVPGEAAPAKEATQVLSVPATPPKTWAATAPAAGLSLGVLLIGVGGLMWWRRQ